MSGHESYLSLQVQRTGISGKWSVFAIPFTCLITEFISIWNKARRLVFPPPFHGNFLDVSIKFNWAWNADNGLQANTQTQLNEQDVVNQKWLCYSVGQNVVYDFSKVKLATLFLHVFFR